jgi:hypothetical protein
MDRIKSQKERREKEDHFTAFRELERQRRERELEELAELLLDIWEDEQTKSGSNPPWSMCIVGEYEKEPFV